MSFGIIILLIGVLFLLNNLGLIVITASVWNIIWPCILIAIGLSLSFGRRYRWEAKIRKKFGGETNDKSE